MSEFNQSAVIEAYREGLIDRDEAREALGFHDRTEADDRVLELEAEVRRLKRECDLAYAAGKQVATLRRNPPSGVTYAA